MVLAGWDQAPSAETNGKTSADNAGSSSAASSVEADNNVVEVVPGKKRKHPEVPEDAIPTGAEGTKGKKKLEVLDDDDVDLVMLDDGNFGGNKKIRQQ